MKLIINDEEKDMPQIGCIQDVVREMGYGGKSIAVALNGNFVARSQFADTALNENDELDIVAPMSGG